MLLNLTDKIKEGQTQLNKKEHYRPTAEPMVEDTNRKVLQLNNELYLGDHIDVMTTEWFCQTPKSASNFHILHPH